MATGTRTTTGLRTVRSSEWAIGVIGGFVGSILFGLMMQYVMPPPLLEVVSPAMYGIQGPALAVGWALHLFHGVVLGLAYIALVQSKPLRNPARRLSGSIVLGVGYGVLTTVLLTVLAMPIWLSAADFPGAPSFPNMRFRVPSSLSSGTSSMPYLSLWATP